MENISKMHILGEWMDWLIWLTEFYAFEGIHLDDQL